MCVCVCVCVDAGLVAAGRPARGEDGPVAAAVCASSGTSSRLSPSLSPARPPLPAPSAHPQTRPTGAWSTAGAWRHSPSQHRRQHGRSHQWPLPRRLHRSRSTPAQRIGWSSLARAVAVAMDEHCPAVAEPPCRTSGARSDAGRRRLRRAAGGASRRRQHRCQGLLLTSTAAQTGCLSSRCDCRSQLRLPACERHGGRQCAALLLLSLVSEEKQKFRLCSAESLFGNPSLSS